SYGDAKKNGKQQGCRAAHHRATLTDEAAHAGAHRQKAETEQGEQAQAAAVAAVLRAHAAGDESAFIQVAVVQTADARRGVAVVVLVAARVVDALFRRHDADLLRAAGPVVLAGADLAGQTLCVGLARRRRVAA